MRRVVAITLALPPLLYVGAALLWGLFDAAMQCDEICRPDSADWRYTRGAWQWWAIAGLGAGTFAAGIRFFASVVGRRPLAALVWLLLGTATVTTGLWQLRVNPGSDQDLDLELSFFAVSAAVFVSGVVAALLARQGLRGPKREAGV
jgi:hypothetical protein